jgi:hypothetical protein
MGMATTLAEKFWIEGAWPARIATNWFPLKGTDWNDAVDTNERIWLIR